ncbi:MAG: hypothetical protein GX950_01445 [Candidatus Diapherotrites archaeon]|jgi:hypothetical protein|uniref:Uncharacterized protein n=1 Tax=Candidatus Iainarchaeum sp. TaxID=3101447 RepID=A0A7K4BYX1_9ARCH|nr:hypothetical protein [Candidatus Diapherotrites archaeon]
MKNESIIQVIQKMVQEGQSREKIVSTLKDLGVNDEQAKKLLLIAEADTFTLLKKEINSMVREEFSNNKKDFDNLIRSELKKIEDNEKERVEQVALAQLGQVEKDVLDKTKAFETRVNEVVGSSQKTVGMVKIALDSVHEKLSQVELDIEQIKVHKYRKKTMLFSYGFLVLGLLILLFSFGLFVVKLNELDLQQMLIIGLAMLTSIVFMFASIVS